jgi:hypothetical protein
MMMSATSAPDGAALRPSPLAVVALTAFAMPTPWGGWMKGDAY